MLASFLLGAVSFSTDPHCTEGIASGSACCAKSCGLCGGPGCGHAPGGSAACCSGNAPKWPSCDMNSAPCKLSPPPAPATACGDYPEPLSATQPNVLLIGDSISMPIGPSPGGYGMDAKIMLNNHSINVWHNGGWGKGGQASNTVKV